MLLFYSAASLIEIRKWNPQASGLAQPPGSSAEVESVGLGSGAKVQSLATLLWGLTPEGATLLRGPDPRGKVTLIIRIAK